MPGLPAVQGSSQAWASVGSMWSTSLNEGWLNDQRILSTGSFASNSSPSSSGYIITSSGDGTTGTGNSFYTLGRAIRVIQGATTVYGWVATASVALGLTTVGISSGSASGALPSTATAITAAVGGPVGTATLEASTTPSATTRFHREDGTWATPPTPALSGCRAYNSANITIQDSSGLALTFDSERFDTDNYHSVVSQTSRMTVPTGKAGYFLIGANARLSYSASDHIFFLNLQVNGTTIIARQLVKPPTYDSYYVEIALSTLYKLADADYVEVIAYHEGTGVNQTIVSVANYTPEFWIARIGS